MKMGELKRRIFEALVMYGLDDEDTVKLKNIFDEARRTFPHRKPKEGEELVHALLKLVRDRHYWFCEWLHEDGVQKKWIASKWVYLPMMSVKQDFKEFETKAEALHYVLLQVQGTKVYVDVHDGGYLITSKKMTPRQAIDWRWAIYEQPRMVLAGGDREINNQWMM